MIFIITLSYHFFPPRISTSACSFFTLNINLEVLKDYEILARFFFFFMILSFRRGNEFRGEDAHVSCIRNKIMVGYEWNLLEIVEKLKP